MTCHNIAEDLYLIDLDQDMTGFRKFIGSWVYLGKSLKFLVDPGPSHSIDYLMQKLEELQVDHLDYILLTHIHIDHAGGTGKLLEKFPDVSIICHPKGIDHMIDPGKLWEGSLKVLGDIARGYGPIIPVIADRISYQEQLVTAEGKILVVQTPGHAVHHLCYQFKDWVFAGEVAGVRHISDSGSYARPATPPVFKLEVSLDSLDKTIALQPKKLCLGHYGYVEDPLDFLSKARNQLIMWVDIAREELSRGDDNLMERIVSALRKKDGLISGYDALDQDIKQREEYFIGNSIKGMLQYLKNQA